MTWPFVCLTVHVSSVTPRKNSVRAGGTDISTRGRNISRGLSKKPRPRERCKGSPKLPLQHSCRSQQLKNARLFSALTLGKQCRFLNLTGRTRTKIIKAVCGENKTGRNYGRRTTKKARTHLLLIPKLFAYRILPICKQVPVSFFPPSNDLNTNRIKIKPTNATHTPNKRTHRQIFIKRKSFSF